MVHVTANWVFLASGYHFLVPNKTVQFVSEIGVGSFRQFSGIRTNKILHCRSVRTTRITQNNCVSISLSIKGRPKGSPYSITERRVPELIPVLGSQPAGDVNHKPGGRLPLLSFRPAVTPHPLKGLLPILLLGEQRHNGCEQFA